MVSGRIPSISARNPNLVNKTVPRHLNIYARKLFTIQSIPEISTENCYVSTLAQKNEIYYIYTIYIYIYMHGSRFRCASITNCIHSKVFQLHVATTATYARGALEGNWSLELMM
jgi:hypothetical protein